MSAGAGGRGRILGVAAVCGLAVSVAGCAEVAEQEEAPSFEPVAVVKVDGTEADLVRIDPGAARVMGLRTARVSVTGRGIAVPYSAVIYDADGGAWVYREVKPLRFLRQRIVVKGANGGTAWLRPGLAAGTRVATRGSAELYGAEKGIAGVGEE